MHFYFKRINCNTLYSSCFLIKIVKIIVNAYQAYFEFMTHKFIHLNSFVIQFTSDSYHCTIKLLRLRENYKLKTNFRCWFFFVISFFCGVFWPNGSFPQLFQICQAKADWGFEVDLPFGFQQRETFWWFLFFW